MPAAPKRLCVARRSVPTSSEPPIAGQQTARTGGNGWFNQWRSCGMLTPRPSKLRKIRLAQSTQAESTQAESMDAESMQTKEHANPKHAIRKARQSKAGDFCLLFCSYLHTAVPIYPRRRIGHDLQPSLAHRRVSAADSPRRSPEARCALATLGDGRAAESKRAERTQAEGMRPRARRREALASENTQATAVQPSARRLRVCARSTRASQPQPVFGQPRARRHLSVLIRQHCFVIDFRFRIFESSWKTRTGRRCRPGRTKRAAAARARKHKHAHTKVWYGKEEGGQEAASESSLPLPSQTLWCLSARRRAPHLDN